MTHQDFPRLCSQKPTAPRPDTLARLFMLLLVTIALTTNAIAENALALTPILQGVDYGSISPDGNTVVFISYNEEKKRYELSLKDLATGKESLLHASTWIVGAMMDPSGTRVVFTGTAKERGRELDGLWIINRDGSGLKSFPSPLSAGSEDRYPFWSPDGKHLAFTRDGHIWMALSDGSHPRLIAKGGPDSFATVRDWMDSTLLVARADFSGDEYTLYLMEQETGKLTELGLQTSEDAIFIDSTETLLYGTGPLHIWNVEDDEEDLEYLPIEPSFQSNVWLSRSTDSTKVLLETVDDMDTSIHHLYLIDTD